MGRAKTSAKQKSNVPILFPHDGPIARSEGSSCCQSIDVARILDGKVNTSDGKLHILVASLIQNLQRRDTTTKEQLQALQSFKCSFLNATNQSSISYEDRNLLMGLYRLLLEWSLSWQTPLPFQRAIQSILKVLASKVEEESSFEISRTVLESIWNQTEAWMDPLRSFDVAVNWPPLREILQTDLFCDCLAFLGNSKTVSTVLETDQGSPLSSKDIDTSLLIVTMLKTILTASGGVVSSTEIIPPRLQDFVLALFFCPNLPSDGFNTLGILHGKILGRAIHTETKEAMIDLFKSTVAALDSNEPNYQGLSDLARLSMVQGIAATLDAEILMANEKDSPLEVSWEYILRIGKTSTDPLVRWAAIKGLSTLASRWRQHQNSEGFQHQDLIRKTLDLVFDSWENPPLRKLGTAIPGLFKALVQLLPLSDLKVLCEQVWKQPANRKGRYLALEILLPYMPATQLQDDSVPIPMESLLEGIGDRGSNAGSIANLWIKLLKRVWEELSAEGSTEEAFPKWMEYWIPSFCKTILHPSLTRRKQVMAFCLPRIADLMKEIKVLKESLPLVFVRLLEEIELSADELHLSDCILWAELETIRYSSVMKISDEALNRTIALCLHRKKLRLALVHSLPAIRIIAFQSMDRVVSSYGPTTPLQEEAALWRFALPFSIKTNESKEYLSNFLQCLSNFLDRLSGVEAGSKKDSKEASLPIFESFVIDFLIGDIVLKKGIYPGTICDKELFGVSLLDSLLAFVLQDESYLGDNTTTKKNAVFNRKRLPLEVSTMQKVLNALVRRDVLASLFALLHSIWDNARVVTWRFLEKMIVACNARDVALANEYSDGEQRKFILARSVYLASSPRQREADTGARMIAFLYASTIGRTEKDVFLKQIVDLSMIRVSSMKRTLADILSGNSSSTDGSSLPLAHGLVQATRLCIEHDEAERRLRSLASGGANADLNASMIEVFCKALQLSLSVVADVRDGETVDGIDEDALFATNGSRGSDSTPLNVNTGAIGANGTFSSVSETNEEEGKARLAMQRVVVGSWLLTKETCAAIASVITMEGYEANCGTIAKVGQLLLSTLTTLKHAGAAFAARDALQIIAIHCLKSNRSPDVRPLPDAWSHRLVDEISLNERVRNSTLRRSTGYALGFLAIMRADVGSKLDSSVLSVSLLHQLLRLSLPPEQRILEAFAKLNLSDEQNDGKSMFVFASSKSVHQPYILDNDYEGRCRVHALNVLRMIILDAPLASIISPLVGDAIVSAILGYDDPSWAIRNSSTMVFAAAMLRVIDSDKNASNTDKTSSNAITLTELFRRYPPLLSFIPSVLRICIEEMETKGTVKSEMFPILLMLSRVQPVVDSSTKVSDSFTPLLFRCLGSRDHGIRHAAARSLANLTTKSTGSTFLVKCNHHLVRFASGKEPNWNLLDGTLLAMDALDMASNEKLFDTKSQTILFRITESSTVPPSCRSTALGILLASKYVQRDALVALCVSISSNDSISSKIGGSLLYKTASEGLCRIYQENIWHAKNGSDLERALMHLKAVFVSDIIDVRLYAVKCFKKEIYGNLDQLGGLMEAEVDGRLRPATIFNELASMLLECVAAEMGRGIADPKGSHIPTVRRLSRCFLETVDATPSVSLHVDENDTLWSIAHEITEREYSFLKVESDNSNEDAFLESDGGNVLSSNAVEMMGVSVARPQESNERQINQNDQHIETLLKVVDSLNDPSGSWRSRYSSALALEKCCMVIAKPLESTPLSNQEHLRKKIQRTVLEMLQDSDPDVRSVAVRIASKFYSSGGEEIGLGSMKFLLLPEFTLIQTFPSTFTLEDHGNAQLSTLLKSLLSLVCEHCHGIADAIRDVKDEFGFTCEHSNENIHNLRRLVNANSMRKIFEDEDPNPFQEKILLNQLAIQSIVDLTNDATAESKLDSALKNTIEDVITICDSALTLLTKTQAKGGTVHDLSRFPSVFPGLHSILCASAASIHVVQTVGEDTDMVKISFLQEKVQASAREIVSLDSQKHWLDPEIGRAIRLISQPQRLKGAALKELLFLLNCTNSDSL